MFTRAGFKPQHIVVCRARVRFENHPREFEARLIRFTPSGDFAWYSQSGSFLVWGESVRIVSRFYFDSATTGQSHIATYRAKLKAALEAGVLRDVA